MKLRKAIYTKDGETRESQKLYGDFYDHQNVRRRLPLFLDAENSQEAARAIDRLVSIRASGDIPPPELRRFVANTLPQIREKLVKWDIVDSNLGNASEPLDQLIDAWRSDLLSGGVETQYVDLKTTRVRTLFREAGMQRWNDIRADRVRQQLQRYRSVESRPISVTTSNHYLQAAK